MPVAMKPRSTIPIVARRQRGHLPHRVLPGERLGLAHVAAEHARERAEGARVLSAGWSIAPQSHAIEVVGCWRNFTRSASTPNGRIADGLPCSRMRRIVSPAEACCFAHHVGQQLSGRRQQDAFAGAPPNRAVIASSVSATMRARCAGSLKRFSISSRPPSCAHGGDDQRAEARSGRRDTDRRRPPCSGRAPVASCIIAEQRRRPCPARAPAPSCA